MEEQHIVELFFRRDERALSETRQKYSRYLLRIAYNILQNQQDAEECLNDTLLRAWNAIPPHRPRRLSVFLGKIARHRALDLYATLTAEKRGGSIHAQVLEEWRDCLPANDGDPADDLTVRDALSRFLRQLPAETRHIFILRYWYGDSIRAIATTCHATESRIKMTLSRTREQLKTFLEKEGIAL